jgi:hypothetical protein
MSPTHRLPKERVLALDPKDVEAYLLARGWEADPRASSPTAGIYRWPANAEVETRVPRDHGFVDYALRLSEVLQAVAAMEHRTAWEMLEDLLARSADSSANGPAPSPGGAPGAKRDAS